MALRADDVDLARDSLLVLRYQAGDGEAFDDLYRRYFDRLQRFCLRRVGDPHEAEEVAQEAFTRALRAMPNFGGDRRFYPWVTVIAARLCVDTHRRRSRSEPASDIDLGVVEPGHDHLWAEVDRDHLGLAFGRLAPRHREVLKLREHEGWSYQRIADHYGVTLGTVEALLHRARRALRREFLAVSGEGRGLVAIPLMGWALRRLQGVRLRVAAHAPQLADLSSPLAATAVSVALAVGGGAMLGNAPASAPASVRTSGPMVASPTLATAVSRVEPAAPAPDASAPDTPSAPAGPTEAVADAEPQSAAVGGPLGGPEITSGDEARKRTADAPLRADVGDGLVGAGVDPEYVTEWVDEEVVGRLP